MLILCLLLLAAYLSIAISHAIRIPYGLIDDLGDWRQIGIFNSLPAFVKRNFFSLQTGERFRPVHVMLQAVLYRIFLDRPGCHHLVRVGMKLSVLGGTALLLYLLAKGKRASAEAFAAGLLYFTALFLLHPIAPEARLAPQEVPQVVLLVLLLLVLFYDRSRHRFHLSRLGWRQALVLYLIVMLLAGVKENSMALIAAAVAAFWLREPRGIRRFALQLKSLPIVAMLLFAAIKTRVASQSGYGAIEPITAAKAVLGLLSPPAQITLLPASPLGLVLFALPALFALHLIRAGSAGRPFGETYDDSGRFLILFSLIALSLLSLIGIFYPCRTPRYYFPNLYVWSLLNAALMVGLWDRWAGRPRLKGLLVVLLLYFPLSNAVDFYFQWAGQVEIHNSEKRLLDFLEARLSEGAAVTVEGNSEYEYKIGVYFAQYLPALGRCGYEIRQLAADSFDKAEAPARRDALSVSRRVLCPAPVFTVPDATRESAVLAAYRHLDRLCGLLTPRFFCRWLEKMHLIARQPKSPAGNLLLIDAGTAETVQGPKWYVCPFRSRGPP